jgi:hypothetical protein
MPPLSLLAATSLPVIPSGTVAPFAWSLVLSGAVVILSLIPLAAGRAKADFSPADLAAPRAMFERLPAWGKRASWAHQNSFEAFTLHAPACLLVGPIHPERQIRGRAPTAGVGPAKKRVSSGGRGSLNHHSQER